MTSIVYEYTDDSWVDGHEDCPCCSGLTFGAYNAVGWQQNGSASSLWCLYVDVLVHYKSKENNKCALELGEYAYLLYEDFTLQALKEVCNELGIIVREIK